MKNILNIKPRSIFQLTLSGFLLITGILVVSLLTSVEQLKKLSNSSQQTITLSSKALRISSTLTEQSAAMERNALQFNATHEQALLEIYRDRREKFTQATRELGSLNLGSEIQDLLTSLVSDESDAYNSLIKNTTQDVTNMSYPPLLKNSYQISSLINGWSEQQLTDIRNRTDRTRNLLGTQGIVLTIIALILAVIFTTLITRPLSQIKRSINNLGKGKYNDQIIVNGPKDLVELGSLIEWLRSRLENLEQQRASFLRHVTHELKTPLAAMQESSSLLNDGVAGTLTAKQQEILQIQGESCKRLQSLIDDLLRFNNDSFSVLRSKPEIIQADALLAKVISAHELSLKQKNIQVHKSIQECHIKVIPEQIRVVIDNMLSNAIKFSPPDSEIWLSLSKKDNQVILDIKDQGPGIAEDDREKIFDAFYQAETTIRNTSQGTGLGLAIAREYARANGGLVGTRACEQGSHFQLRLAAVTRERT